MPRILRDYPSIAAALNGLPESTARDDRMRRVIDPLWECLHSRGVSWVGFYVDQPGHPDDVRMILGPCRDKPACSPIGLHGACGQALRSGRTLIVRDVKSLGPNYIACDPRDQSEIVVPLIDEDGRAWAVLDVDSWEVGSFDESDDEGLRTVLRTAGLVK